MNLKDFVKNVLIDLDKAIDEAREQTSRNIQFWDSDNTRTVEFDIAVSVEDKTKKDGEGSIKVLKFVGLDIGGKLGQQSTNSTVSRIKFGVKIDELTKEEWQSRRSQF